VSDNTETAILAGGCAWIMQQLLRHPDGVISTRVDWTGGEGENPTEENPRGHAEARSSSIRSGGSIYRSEIFYTSEEQRSVAEEATADVDASGHWLGKTVTEISEAGRFWEDPAENQDYFQRFPDYPEGSKPPFPRTGVEAANHQTAA
jgi:peptide-methionine (S)-S-oxide reductase